MKKPIALGARNMAAANPSRSVALRPRPRLTVTRRVESSLAMGSAVLDVLGALEQGVELRLHLRHRVLDARAAQEDRRHQLLGEHHIGLLPGGGGPERLR